MKQTYTVRDNGTVAGADLRIAHAKVPHLKECIFQSLPNVELVRDRQIRLGRDFTV